MIKTGTSCSIQWLMDYPNCWFSEMLFLWAGMQLLSEGIWSIGVNINQTLYRFNLISSVLLNPPLHLLVGCIRWRLTKRKRNERVSSDFTRRKRRCHYCSNSSLFCSPFGIEVNSNALRTFPKNFVSKLSTARILFQEFCVKAFDCIADLSPREDGKMPVGEDSSI